MHGTSFDWITWTGCTIHDFDIPCRYESIIANSHILKKYAIGWCPGEEIICRPKVNEIAVMFLVKDREFWFHLRKNEFNEIFINNQRADIG